MNRPRHAIRQDKPLAETHRRSGLTLIQMLVSITLIGTISAVAITLIIRMMQAEGTATEAWAIQQTLARLATDFRRDVHSATDAEIDKQNEDSVLILKKAGRSGAAVTFTASSGTLVREERLNDRRVAAESYSLPTGRIHFEITSRTASGRPVLQVTLICQRTTIKPTSAKISLPVDEERIVAMTTRNHRFEKTDPKP